MPKMSHATIHSCDDEQPSILPDTVRECLDRHFRSLMHRDRPARDPVRGGHRIDAGESERLARLVARTMLDAAGARPVTGSSDANRAVLESRIAGCIRRNDPVAAHMLWSPKKHWVTGEENAVDLAEFAALDTLYSVHAAVRDLYEPGMAFQLDVEDLEFEFMEGADPDLMQARERYVHGLRRLIDVLGSGDVFSVARVSEKAADAAELRRWHAQMAENSRALEAYWYESERAGIEHSEGLSSYKALCDLGWTGPIPAEMRRHYLDRLGSLPSGEESAKVAMVLRNLAGILLHRQKGLGSGRAGRESVKFSFVPPACGAPPELLTGRVDLRFVPRKVCSRVGAAGPWSTKGYLRRHDGRLTPAFAGWHQTRAVGARFREGRLTVVRSGEAAAVRADYLLE